jgi:hypothetical protein
LVLNLLYEASYYLGEAFSGLIGAIRLRLALKEKREIAINI